MTPTPPTLPTPLWLALHFPRLPLEANAPLSSPSAVVADGRVVLADAQARAAGVDRGCGVAAARLLAPAITLMARHPAREAATLHALACWAGRFTPRLSLTLDTLLLEVSSCLRLFGGLDKLAGAVGAGVHAQGFDATLAAAPTALGAQWLAQRGTTRLCRDLDSLRQHLEDLPIEVLPDQAVSSLKRFGAATLADVRRLPGAELARRVGPQTRLLMARAFGESADPRVDFVFPDRFVLAIELPSPVDHASALLFAARRLISALAGWLGARQAGVREFSLDLVQRHDEERLRLQFSAPTSDEKRFDRVLRERLERMVLAAPVDALRIEATQLCALPGRSLALFNDAEAGPDALAALLERLAARLGETQVYRLAAHDDHRPECATRRAALQETLTPGQHTALPRPLWLVAPPQALTEVDGRPCRRGPLKLLAGPERIESGWWDSDEMNDEHTGETNAKARGASADVRRDYFIALSSDGCWLWIYRDIKLPGGWFVHGFFA